MGSRFEDETEVRRVAPGSYEATIPEVWNLQPLPQGGVVTAMALRAMTQELDHPEQRIRTLHTTFAAQVAHGPVTITVDVLRRGRSMSHLRAEVTNVGAPRGHLTTAVFGATRRGFSFTDLVPPAVPPPSECRSFRDPPPPGIEGFRTVPFWQERLEGRAALGHAPWEDVAPERAEQATWYRFDETPQGDDGTMDPLALVVMADSMPGAVGQLVGRPHRDWFAPSVDLTVHLLDDCRSPWVLGHNLARHAGDGYASAEMALWDCGPEGTEQPRLVAYATQVFVFTFR
jgi:acyl-CoA thioesterase